MKDCCECSVREKISERLYALNILAILSCFASKHTTDYVDAHKTILNIFFITRPSPWRKPHKTRRRMHPPSRMLEEGISFVRQAQEAKADIRVHEISLTTAELARGLDTTNRVIPVVDVSAVRLSVRGVLQSVLGLRRSCDSCTRNGEYYVFNCSLLWYESSDCARVACKASFSDAVPLSPALPISSTVASIRIIDPLSRAALRQFGARARSFANCSASGTTVSSALTVKTSD